ncbi:MAG TPA: hypothetical protein VLC12_08425 [Terriglobales bacterium]|nr:hypothetical protein [Terriglobales bacterium]
MSLFERVRATEHQGREAAWQGLSRARTSLEEAQSLIRRKMRLHPGSTKPALPVYVSLKTQGSAPAQPIVSINGKDLPPEEVEASEGVA